MRLMAFATCRFAALVRWMAAHLLTLDALARPSSIGSGIHGAMAEISRGLCCSAGAARLREEIALANLGFSIESRAILVELWPSASVMVISQLFAKWVTLATCANAHWESKAACESDALAAGVS